MSFADDVRRFADKVERVAAELHADTVTAAFGSIVDGSPVTGSEGQRVDTGFLRSSWRQVPLGPLETLIGTPVAYAPLFEGEPYDPRGVQRPADLRSHGPSVVGLRNYSVLLTRLSWARLVDAVVAQRGNRA